MTQGFFTRGEQLGKVATRAQLRKAALVVPVSQLHRLGLRGVEGMNKRATTPNLQPDGDAQPTIYVLGVAPGEEEDAKGAPFAGRAGALLRREVGEDVRARFDYMCRTMPPDDREPEWHEVECFRPSVVADIEKARPRVVLAVGAPAFNWCVPVGGTIAVGRGRRFPARIGTHKCWVVPTYEPDYIVRLKAQAEARERKKNDEAPPEEVVAAWERDMEWVRGCDAWPDAEPFDLATLDEGIERITDTPSILRALKELGASKALAFDIETNGLRPYAANAQVLSVAFSDGKRTVAFPLHHSRKEYDDRVLAALRALFRTVPHFIAHNLSFDLEWMYSILGTSCFTAVQWHDTMASAFVLDERRGALSLDYLCQQRLGLALKAQSKMTQAIVMNLANQPLDRVLLYNARDAKSTFFVHVEQWPLVKADGVLPVYRMNTRRISTFVLSQRLGVLADVAVARELDAKYDAILTDINARASALPEVREYESRFGKFRLSANEDIGRVLTSAGLIKRGASTDADALEGIKHPLARLVLDYRTTAKLRGTYITAFLPGAKDGHVFPDGRVHCVYKTMGPATGRSACEDPNLQNAPKRGKGKEVRRVIRASPGNRLLAVDYKQLEAWVIACASQDEKFVHSMRTGYDVHAYWAQRFAKRCPQVLERRDIAGDMKAFRSATKNEWVFPMFFGSSWRSCARSIGVSEDDAEAEASVFWRDFAGVKTWQKTVTNFYAEHHYVETLTGRRRHAPLGYNQVINTPVQGTASDLVVNAMCTLSELARTKQLPPWCQPVLNVHDDLTFDVPKDEVDSTLALVTPIMLDVSPYPWAILPLACEAESGDNWGEMSVVGTFKGTDPCMSGA